MMKLDSSERIRSITDLVMLLFDKELPEQESDDSVPAGSPDKEATAVFQTHSQSGRTGQHRTAGTGQQPAARPRSSSRSRILTRRLRRHRERRYRILTP